MVRRGYLGGTLLLHGRWHGFGATIVCLGFRGEVKDWRHDGTGRMKHVNVAKYDKLKMVHVLFLWVKIARILFGSLFNTFLFEVL